MEIEPGPSHDSFEGVSIRVTTGYRLIIEFTNQKFTNRFDQRNFYWKHGLHHKAHRWLKQNFGEQCMSRLAWNNENPEDGQWIYLGSQRRKKSTKNTVTLQFREKSQALLFKLTWGGRL